MKVTLVVLLCIQYLLAAPAYNKERSFIQPNGEVVVYSLNGDEHLHWFESKYENIMLYSKKNKRMESVIIEGNTLKASGIAISQNKKLSAKSSQKVTRKEVLELQNMRRGRYHKNTLNKHK